MEKQRGEENEKEPCQSIILTIYTKTFSPLECLATLFKSVFHVVFIIFNEVHNPMIVSFETMKIFRMKFVYKQQFIKTLKRNKQRECIIYLSSHSKKSIKYSLKNDNFMFV